MENKNGHKKFMRQLSTSMTAVGFYNLHRVCAANPIHALKITI